MILIKAFQEHLIWGVCCLLFPPVPVLIFAFMNLDKCWFALGIGFAGILLYFGMVFFGFAQWDEAPRPENYSAAVTRNVLTAAISTGCTPAGPSAADR